MDYFSLVGIIFTAPGMLVTLFLVNKIGLKVNNTVLISIFLYVIMQWCIRVGTWFIFLGSMIRMVATFPTLESGIEPHQRFYLVLGGHCLVAMGHPFIIVITTQVITLRHSKTVGYPVQTHIQLTLRDCNRHETLT